MEPDEVVQKGPYFNVDATIPLAVNVIDRITSTSIILMDQHFNANEVDIMVFEHCVVTKFPVPTAR